MAKMFWSFRLFIDEVLMVFANLTLSFWFLLQSMLGKKNHMRENVLLKNKHADQMGFLVANGPSINKQNLLLLTGHTCFFVNQSFRHPEYSAIAPKYHVLLDTKLVSGEWDITWLDEIVALNPNVTLLLNEKWYNHEKFKNYKSNEKFKIVWIDCRNFVHKYLTPSAVDLTKTAPGIAVTGAAFTAMAYMGFKTINMVGQDGNGLCYELVDDNSHFYGKNQENSRKSIRDIQKDLCQMSLSIKQWINLSEYCERNSLTVINCTAGGIFDMFDRDSLENATNQQG